MAKISTGSASTRGIANANTLSPVRTPGKRLFVALWPKPATQRALAALVDNEQTGRPVLQSNLHLTLAFIGTCTEEQEARYRDALRDFTFDAFTLSIDTLGWWRVPRVLWAGPRETPPALATLAHQVGERLSLHGFVPESRPFAAHITLIRKYPGPAPKWDMQPTLHWHADTIALVESQSTAEGVRYRPLLRIGASA